MNDLSDDTLDITVALGIVQSTELRNTLTKVSVSHKDGSLGTLSLTYTCDEYFIFTIEANPQQ